MYARLARFEGEGDNWDERIAGVRERMATGMASADGPPVTRALMLVDRVNGLGAAVTFCESEDDLRKVDAFMNSMSPPAGTGTRTSVELYEVALDSEQL